MPFANNYLRTILFDGDNGGTPAAPAAGEPAAPAATPAAPVPGAEAVGTPVATPAATGAELQAAAQAQMTQASQAASTVLTQTPPAAGEQPPANPGEQQQQPQGAPEQYEQFQLPEGYALNTEQLAEFTPIARDLNLSQEQAQQLIDFDIARQQRQAQTDTDQHVATIADYEQEARADPEIGGQAFDENMSVAKLAIDAFGNDNLKAFLESTGGGSHVEVLRFAHKVGKEIGEDRLRMALGNPRSQDPQSIAKIFFPNMN